MRDVWLAEELAHDALVAALEEWPKQGTPDNPGAWLMATAKHRALDTLRHGKLSERKQQALSEAHAVSAAVTKRQLETAPDEDVGDDLLRLIFIACHPVLSTEARVALTLRLLGGLSTEEIARAYLLPEATIAQRIVRAKRTLAKTGVGYEMPDRHQIAQRLSSVLEVVYLIFNEGYTATGGEDWLRLDLCADALLLGRTLVQIAPQESEVHGLLALMEIQSSRSAARLDAQGEPVRLLEQDRSRWDALSIRRGFTALERAQALAASPGSYTLQAAIAACHARATHADETDWNKIALLYEALGRVTPSPVVELNRAVAVSMAQGPAEGLALVDRLRSEPALERYPWLPSVRGDLLFKLKRFDEARKEFERAAELTQNERERSLLERRAQECTH